MKTIITLVTGLALCTTTMAQKEEPAEPRKFEIQATYGMLTTSQIIDAFVKITTAVGSLGTVTTSDNKSTGGLYFTAHKLSSNNRFAYGIAVGYDGSNGNFRNDAGTKSGSYKSSSITIAGEGKINYMNKPNFRLYGFLGAGYTSYNYTFTTTSGGSEKEETRLNHINFQLTPIGAAFGDKFGGLLELGLGYKGLLNIGLFARF